MQVSVLQINKPYSALNRLAMNFFLFSTFSDYLRKGLKLVNDKNRFENTPKT